MSGLSKARSLGAIISGITLGIWAAHGAPGNRGYLKSVGPPPLRFEEAAVNNPVFIAELALPSFKKATVTNMPEPATSSPKAVTEIAGGPNLTGILAGKNGPPFFGPANTAADSGNSASDLLSINPQMINEYFRPNRKEAAPDQINQYQPGQTIFVPAELGFVPPVAAQSRAVYTSK